MQDTDVFEGDIFFYPTRKENDTWYVKGVFCSLACTKAYVIDNLRENHDTLGLFMLMCKTAYGISESITPAPPQFLHMKFHPPFGGVELDEFRNYTYTNDRSTMTTTNLYKHKELVMSTKDHLTKDLVSSKEYQPPNNQNNLNTEGKQSLSTVLQYPSRNITTLENFFSLDPSTQRGVVNPGESDFSDSSQDELDETGDMSDSTSKMG